MDDLDSFSGRSSLIFVPLLGAADIAFFYTVVSSFAILASSSLNLFPFSSIVLFACAMSFLNSQHRHESLPILPKKGSQVLEIC